MDLRVAGQWDCSRVTVPAPSVDVGDDAAARRPEMAPIEALLPQIEELPEPETLTVKVTGSPTCGLALSKPDDIVKFPTPPEKPSGFPARGG